MARVEIPERERPLRSRLAIESNLDEAGARIFAIVMLVDFRCDPKTITVTNDAFEAVCLTPADEYDNLLTRFRQHVERFIILKLPPPATAPEKVLKPESVTVADVHLGVGDCRPACEMKPIRALLKVVHGNYAVVNSFTASDGAFSHAHAVA